MAKNKVKALRTRLGLTQSQLAERADTSQQQIQRIEGGQTTRLDQATAIAKALGELLEHVFPSVRRPLAKLRKGDPARVLDDEALQREFEDAGIDPDPRVWTFRFVLTNGTHRDVVISSRDQDRLWRGLQEDRARFAVFDTSDERVAIKSSCLAFWQFLFDPPRARRAAKPKSGDPEERPHMKFWLTSLKEPWPLFVDPDEMEFGTEEADEYAPIQGLFFDLENCIDDDDIFSLLDEDGERAFFRVASLVMVTAPLEAISPDFSDEDEDEKAG